MGLATTPGMSMDSLNPPDNWMPPKSVLNQMVSLINLQIEYLLSVGKHKAALPNFLARGCLKNEMMVF